MVSLNIILLFSFLSGSFAINIHPIEVYEKLFFQWMETHGMKFLEPSEFKRRLQIFSDNHDLITQHNAKKLSYELGHNQFSYMTLTEFHDYIRLGGTRPGNLRKRPTGITHEGPVDSASLPKEVDWVKAGGVTEVKNQGACGSCWSFSAVGALEGAYYVKHKKLISFSEQELVSCDTKDYGCNGGFMDDAFAWIEQNGGLCSEADYEYTSGKGSTGTCEKTCTEVKGSAPKQYNDVKVDSVPSLMSAVAQQPVAIAIEADQFAFQFYKGGVLTAKCGTNLDHGVLLVGYGSLDSIDYWKVKNSWGATWGMEGYILIERGTEDLCGVLASPSYPVL